MQRKQLKNAKITLSILFSLIGIALLFYSYFAGIKSNLFNYKNIKLMEQQVLITEALAEVNDTDLEGIYVDPEDDLSADRADNYIGYLEVPDVNIKRGFVSLNSKYNSVGYNVMLIEGSTMPDVKNGNLILAAHRGNSAVSFFDKLYKLSDGAYAYVTYHGKVYKYQLKSRYYENKDGVLTIKRNAEASVLTLITCTRDDKTTQTIFIFELVSVD
ncbi:MAG: sortase [Erysipelotrichales bacterium]|nr:sortase [Erysipelotrichales bacterium]